jgi:hypothetical protein
VLEGAEIMKKKLLLIAFAALQVADVLTTHVVLAAKVVAVIVLGMGVVIINNTFWILIG